VSQAAMRSLRADEAATAADLFLASAGDMAQRHGVHLPHASRDGVLAAYEHIARTGIFRVAEIDGRVVALACAIVRGSWWFLTGFWVQPGMQSRGLGGPLLDEVLREGERAGARVFFTWSSVDPNAMASYMRRGLLPGWPILIFVGEPSTALPPTTDYCVAELDPALPPRLTLAAGHPERDVDHAYLRRTAAAARAVLRDGEAIGYFYARRGSVGPVAWSDDAHAAAVIDASLGAALGLGVPVRVNVPGVAHAAVRHVLARGLRLVSNGHLLATDSPGDMTRYLPSGGFLF
jgi:GNAT superfamily N-acetyltransferase